MINIIALLIIAMFYFLGFGVGVSHYFHEGIESNHWAYLAIATWFSYNIAAFAFNWTMFFGYGGYTKPTEDKVVERRVGLFISVLVIIFAMYKWMN